MVIGHHEYMTLALEEAGIARAENEVPVGALLVSGGGEILARGHNQTIGRCDPSAHAEMLVLRQAARKINNYRLLATTLYVTVEPCVMCMGAIIHARVAQVVYGAPDPKWGAAGSIYNFADDGRLNHQPRIISGICEELCRALISNFFQLRREDHRAKR